MKNKRVILGFILTGACTLPLFAETGDPAGTKIIRVVLGLIGFGLISFFGVKLNKRQQRKAQEAEKTAKETLSKKTTFEGE